MAKKDYSKDIEVLQRSLPFFSIKKDNLSPSDLQVLGKAYSIYAGYCEPILGYVVDPRVEDVYTFHQYINPSEIGSLISELDILNNKEEEEPKQEASIPPELESLVEEYRQNQALLEEDEIKANSQRSVAEQVKIALAHSKIKDLALANRQKRLQAGEKILETDDALVTLGSPKSSSKNEALASSYKAVQEVAFTYSGFSKLPRDIQNQIISSAVELNTVGVSDIDTAIQSSALQIDVSSLDEATKKNLGTIPGGFISTVYQEVVTLDKTTAEYEAKISDNEQEIIKLQDEIASIPEADRAEKSLQVKNLIAENEHLSTSLENQSARFINTVAKQTASFKDFEASREKRLSQDPDLKDRIELANKTVSSLHDNLERNGVQPHIYSPMDDAHLLEEAIRHDLPGSLKAHPTYEAGYAASLVNNPKTKDPELSPEAILLYGKDLTPNLLAKARIFAKENPKSALGKLYKTQKGIFDTAGSQIRKISQSPLGKEITKAATGLGKVFKPLSKFFGKISDKIPGGFGNLFRIAQDPIGAFRSWAGKKVGNYVIKKFLSSAAGKAATAAGKKLAGELLKKGIGKAISSLAIKIGAKLGIEAALAGSVVGAPIALIMVVVDVAVAVLKAGYKAVQKIAKSIYGEELKAHEIIAVPVAAVGTAVTAVVGFFGAIATATVAATGSGLIIIIISVIAFCFIYITSFVSAPLISTLVQLESTPSQKYNGPILPGCPSTWPVGPGFTVNQGPGGQGSHYSVGYDQAIDISTPIGVPIISTTYGVVSFAGYSEEYLNTDIVIVDSTLPDGTTFQVVYAHLSDMSVSEGEGVSVGTPIGLTGVAGTGPHLHYEYKGINYNQCPAGGVQLSENCASNQYPGPDFCSEDPQVYTE